MDTITKKYTNGEVTIVWKPGTCIHSTICWKAATGLPDVFDPRQRPWIKPENATTQQLIDQVDKCPSGALSYYRNDDDPVPVKTETESIVEPMKDGPLMVYGNITVKDSAGSETKKFKATAFCRCGASANKPYCDGTHVKIKFKG